MAQQPPPGSYPNYGYVQQQQAQQQNGNHQQNVVNGFPPTATVPQLKPGQIPAQQLPPQQAINYQNFQTKAIQPGGGVNGSNSALSSRTSSPGAQQPSTLQSQLPPSRSYPSYQQLHGSYPQQQPLSSQLPIPPLINNNNNGDNKTFTPNSPMNAPPPPGTAAPMMNVPQQQLSASMQNLALNSGAPPIPSSRSEQNFLNNNNTNAPGMISNSSMSQMPMKPVNTPMAKRPMYPVQQAAQPPIAPLGQPQFQQQPQAFKSFPGNQMTQQPPQIQQQQPQPRGNLQYQAFPQQQQQQQSQQFASPGSIVSQGFNRMWGNETVDLMQNRHILPPAKVLPPPVKLNHQFHEASNCSTDIFRCTLTKIPESNSLLQKSRLPLGILIHPYRDLSVSSMSWNSRKSCANRKLLINQFVYSRICLLSVARQSSGAVFVEHTSTHSCSS